MTLTAGNAAPKRQQKASPPAAGHCPLPTGRPPATRQLAGAHQKLLSSHPIFLTTQLADLGRSSSRLGLVRFPSHHHFGLGRNNGPRSHSLSPAHKPSLPGLGPRPRFSSLESPQSVPRPRPRPRPPPRTRPAPPGPMTILLCAQTA